MKSGLAVSTEQENVSDGDESRGRQLSPTQSDVLSDCVVCSMTPTSSTVDDSLTDARSPGGKAKRRDDGTKVCGVCGDRAFGINFEAVCCESCKAFFRRNALKEKGTRCLFSGNCTIDRHTRRFCPHCRLKKCVGIGMKKTNILGTQEKRQRMEKVMENRNRRHDKLKAKQDSLDVTENTTTAAANMSVETQLAMLQETAAAIQPSVESYISRSLAEHTPTVTELPNVMTSTPIGKTIYTNNLLSFCRFATMVEPTAIAGDDTRTLTSDEVDAIQELVDVYDLSFTADLEPLIHLKQIDPSLNQLVNQSSITVLRIIKFAKRLSEFAQLDQACQVGILKAAWIHVLLLRSVSLYDSSRDVWVTPKGDIPTEILKNATGYVDLHGEHVAYSKRVKAIIGDDLTIIVIMLTIVLFSPEGAHVSAARQLIANVQDKYIVLLKHYLESSHGFRHGGAEMFPLVIEKLRELKELAEGHSKYLLDVNPREIEPIMLEILDLK